LNGREIPDCFGTVGELVYLAGGPDAADGVTRAASGRVARCARPWAGDPVAAVEAASGAVAATVRPEAVAEFLSGGARDGYIVSIRKEDRERFEETMGGAACRWIGETVEAPARAGPGEKGQD
jgi:hypothetical protein